MKGEPETGRNRMTLSGEEQVFLLRLARQTLQGYLRHERMPEIDATDLTPDLQRVASCFVTLREGVELRGCIGSVIAETPLYRSVIESAIGAATRDPRFRPVTPEELPRLNLHISVLTPSQPLRFAGTDDLLHQLDPLRHGVILRHGWQSAVYLPQVWERFESAPHPKEAFLESLSRKAGDFSGALWRQPNTRIEVFETLDFGEEDR